VLEVQNHADAQFRDPQIIQHGSAFVICDSVDDLCVYYNRLERNQIRHKQADLVAFVKNIENGLLAKWNLS